MAETDLGSAATDWGRRGFPAGAATPRFDTVGRVDSADQLLTARDVAEMFRVELRTVTEWARSGRIIGIQTLGGQWRFRESDMRQALRDGGSGGEV